MMIMIKRRAGENIRDKVVAIFESCGVNIMLLKTREPTGRHSKESHNEIGGRSEGKLLLKSSKPLRGAM